MLFCRRVPRGKFSKASDILRLKNSVAKLPGNKERGPKSSNPHESHDGRQFLSIIHLMSGLGE